LHDWHFIGNLINRIPQILESMNFQKQVQFSRHIKADGRLKEFNFLKLNNVEMPTYSVDVSDERGRRYIFKLRNDGEQWKISGEELPDWLMRAEDTLQEALDAQLHNDQ